MNGISLHFTTCSYLESISLLVLSRKDGITMAFEQNTTGHQINSSHFELYNCNNPGLVAMNFFEQVSEDYGVIEDGLATDENSTEGVPIPRSTVELSKEQFQQLQNLVNPLSESTDYGIDLYQEVIQYLDTIL